MKTFDIYRVEQASDEIGGFIESQVKESTVKGYIDMLSGSDQTPVLNNAYAEKSSHVLITFDVSTPITDDHIVKYKGDTYEVTYVDNPVELDHHREIYLNHLGD